MDATQKGFATTDEYIASFPEEKRALLQAIRNTIKAAAPEAEEKISYQMPSFHLNGYLVYFGAYKNHIGFFHASNKVPEVFKDDLAGYKGSAGTIQLPVNKPLPLDLIRRIVEFRVAENKEKAVSKTSRKRA